MLHTSTSCRQDHYTLLCGNLRQEKMEYLESGSGWLIYRLVYCFIHLSKESKVEAIEVPVVYLLLTV